MIYYRRNNLRVTKLHTVNVIETIDGVPQSLRAFADNKAGNKLAEECFKSLVEEHNKDNGPKFDAEDFEDMFSDGVYDDDCGYVLFLTHST